MPVHAVVLPAAPLLVAGAGGAARPLEATRSQVREALRAVCPPATAQPRWGVLAPGTPHPPGVRRPSLAAAGVADRWVPALRDAAWPGRAAGTEASVALLALADAVGPDIARSALVVEVDHEADLDPQADRDRRAQAVAALATCDVLVVAGGVPGDAGAGPAACAPGVREVLGDLADRYRWHPAVRTVAEDGAHLSSTYEVVTWTAGQAAR